MFTRRRVLSPVLQTYEVDYIEVTGGGVYRYRLYTKSEYESSYDV